jgi:hypothetical protein
MMVYGALTMPVRYEHLVDSQARPKRSDPNLELCGLQVG